jgi:hypothetical protein
MSQKKPTPNSPDVETGHAVGPTSERGLEASEIDKVVPEGERGSVDTDPRRVAARKLPAQTGGTIGGTIGGDAGIRAMPGSADANDHGPRGRN